MILKFTLIVLAILGGFFLALTLRSMSRINRIDRRARFGTDRYIKAGSHSLHYVEFGNGRPLLLIPETIGTYRSWNSILPALSRQFRCLAVDCVGTGDSDKPEDFDYTIPVMADSLIQFLDALNIEKVHLLGVSLGGAVVMNMMGRYPERIGRSVTIEGFATFDPDILMLSNKVASLLKKPVLGPFFHFILQSGILSGSLAKRILMERWNSMNDRERRVFQDEIALMLHSLQRIPTIKILDSPRTSQGLEEVVLRIKTPVLQLTGTRSLYYQALKPTIELLKEVPAVLIWEVEDGNHDLHWQYPKWVAQTVENFILQKGVFAQEEEGRLWKITVNE